MAKYCLSYDAKDALAWDPEELKLEVSRLILESGGSYLESPLVNVILFEDGKDRSDLPGWGNLLNKKIKEDIFYYLCVVPSNKDGDFFERNEGDPDLNDDFQQLLDDMESE